MSGDRYRIYDQQATYFITPTIVRWIDLFSRQEYRDVVVDSLNYCTAHKGLNVHAWVIMSNHLHLVLSVSAPFQFSDVLRDFKRHTSKELIKRIKDIPESRREWLLDAFAYEAKKTRRTSHYKLWQDSNHAVCMGNQLWKSIDYIHNNPVRAGLVDNVAEYRYSSARDYAGKQGLVNVANLSR
ncbi:REP-associated tyrosine transposase [Sediminitomix flava]|uniref:REP element-mobilizing transposase RayT n=1 Tax=Sediminitomix flava TaxID=379075 RepID=A0A315ZCY8_SEDFL|nr:transposase [Sediminitomix flava]PWJ42698.1 REP element-mobilizing transposase RayT [Sediminitomix flava]